MKNRIGKITEEIIIKVTETQYSCSKIYKGSALGRRLKAAYIQQQGDRLYTRTIIWKCIDTGNLFMMPRKDINKPLLSVIERNILSPCYKWRGKHYDQKLQFIKQSGIKTEPIILKYEKLSK